MTDRSGPSRIRTMPPHEVDQHRAADGSHEAELVFRLEQALATLPEAERTAVVSAVGFAGGSVGAAMELGLEIEDADALTRNGLQLLRAALADLDAHGQPLG
jgi:DNA-directed RNA polymerase specialized sigma24 family protein